MAFITAEARSSIVELAMGMLNQAPSTAMLETLIAKSVEGASTQDLADYIATTAAFTAEYPATQTAREFATEMFGKLITGGTLDADINTAVIDLLEGLLTGGTTKAQGFVAVIDFLANPANAAHADLGDIAQSFQNRADAAEYFSITKELGGSTTAELAAAIASVTSDAATLTAANTAADATASAEAVVAGQTFTLTTGLDNKTLGAGADQAFATDSTTAADDTFNVSDAVAGGDGADTFFLTVDSIAGATTYTPSRLTGFETLSVTNLDATPDAVTINTNLMALTGLEVSASSAAVNFTNVTAGTAITLTGNTAAVDIQHKNAGLTGLADSVSVALIGNTGNVTIDSDGVADIESATITATGVNSGSLVIGDSSGSTITSLTVDGAGSLTITATDLATLTTLDASANTGGVSYVGQVTSETVTLTGGAGNDTLTGNTGDDVITGGAGKDTLSTGAGGDDHVDAGAGDDTVIVSNVTKADTIDGGDGTDILEINTALAYSAVTSTNDAAGITGFETLYVNTGLTQDMTGLTGITTLLAGTGDVAKLTKVSGLATVGFYPGASAGADLTLATDGTDDSLVLGLGSDVAQSASTSTTLDAVEYEKITVSSAGADGNSTTITADALTELTVVGSKNVTVTLSPDTGVTTLPLTKIDASGATGTVNVSAASADSGVTVTPGSDALTVTLGDGADTVTGTAKADDITTGKGNDTITGMGGNDTVDAGAGDDKVTLTDGDNDVTLGTGADTLTAGDGDNTVTNTSGNATITLGNGVNNVTNTAGNMTLVTGSAIDTITNTAGNADITSGAGNDIITNTAGNSTIDAGAGNDSITLTAGNSNVDAGAGNDTITAGSGTDTIDAGDGTDTVNISQGIGTFAGSITNAEVIGATLSGSTGTIDLANLNASTLTLGASAAVTTATVKNAPDGTTLNVGEDLTLAGTTGTISALTVDTVDSADISLVVKANANAAVKANTTFAGTVSVTDAVGVAISTQGGTGVDNNLTHTFNALTLDAADTTSLSITAAAYGGLNTGNLGGVDSVETLSVSAGAGAEVTIGTMVEAEALQTVSLTAAGAAAGVDVGAIAGTENGLIQSIKMSASAGGDVDFAAITSTAALDMISLSITSDGTGSTVVGEGAISADGGTIATVNVAATNRGSIELDGAATLDFFIDDLSITATGASSSVTWTDVTIDDLTGTNESIIISATGDNASVDINEAALGAATLGDVSITAGSWATVDMDGTVFTASTSVESFLLDVQSNGTLTSAAGESKINGPLIKSLTLKVGESSSITNDMLTIEPISATAGANAEVDVTYLSLDLYGGSSDITIDLEVDRDIAMIGSTAALISQDVNADNTAYADGTANFDYGKLVTDTSGESTIDVSAATAATAGWTITTGSGNDTIEGSGGNDVITGGAGNDQVTTTAGTDTLNTGSGVDDIVLSHVSGVTTVSDFTDGVDDISEAVTGITAAEVSISAAIATRTVDDNSLVISAVNAKTTSLLATTGTETIADFTDTTASGDVMDYLDEVFSVGASDTALFVLNDGSSSYIYYYLNDADTDFDAGDTLELIGKVTGVVLDAANFT